MRIKTYLFILLAASLLSGHCKKNKTEEQLPPETQTGAGTLGFTIDGTVYKANYPDVVATNIYINFPYPNNSGYFFTLSGGKLNKWAIIVLTDSLKIEETHAYSLSNYRDLAGSAFAKFSDYQKEFYSKPFLAGELRITKLDMINKIVSGTFWFDAIDTLSNNKVEIRQGRFDLRYTE